MGARDSLPESVQENSTQEGHNALYRHIFLPSPAAAWKPTIMGDNAAGPVPIQHGEQFISKCYI